MDAQGPQGALPAFDYTSYAWEKITVPDAGTTPAISINDAPPVFETATGTNATFTVSLSAASQDTITVNYSTKNGTALADTDYQAKSGTITFAPLQTTAMISVPVIGHHLAQHNENFTVVLSNPTESNGSTPNISDAAGIGTLDALFTDAADTVDFNNLTAAQKQAVDAGADLYNSFNGNDSITLPNTANYGSLSWDATKTFVVGAGNDTISGSDGNYNIQLGTGTDTVSIDGNGNTSITTGSGADTIKVTGIDNKTIPNVTILQLDQNDAIDLTEVSFNSTTYSVFETATNTLQIVSNGIAYDLHLDSNRQFTGGFKVMDDGDGGTKVQYVNEAVTDYSTSRAQPVAPPLSAPFNPYGAVVQIFEESGGTLVGAGTGFIIGPHTILTAAHVLLRPSPVGLIANPHVFIDHQLVDLGPSSILIDSQYQNSFANVPLTPDGETHDFGVINTTTDLSHYGMFQLSVGFSEGETNTTGFPGTGGFKQFNFIDGAFLSQDGLLSYQSNFLANGFSGGPVWVYDGSAVKAVGIAVAIFGGIGVATQITSADLAEILGWEAVGTGPNPPSPAGTTADMILRRGDGTYEIYNIGNNAILAAYQLGQVGTNWQFVGLGDFNNTGQAGNAALSGFANTTDMVLRDSNSGAFEVYNISGNNIINAASLGAVGLDWQFGGFGDFSSRPGETDMILRNSSTAALEVYDISNNTIMSAYSMGAVGLEWQVGGFGDFSSRPNETDMIMRNVNTGALEVYDIGNNALISAYSTGAVGLEWQVAGFGHFSSSPNETDMIMRNSNTGAFEVYDIANNSLTNAYSMGAVGLDWQVVGFGNFSGNANETDMILRNSNTGALEGYNIANNTLTAAYPMGAVGLNWQVGGIAPDSLSASSGSSGVDQLVQAMAGFGGSSGASDSLSTVPLGADTSQQQLLTTPQHA
jgi:V8-like Glu-specific endopeptidase